MKDSFVYIWLNITHNKKYIGYHKGSILDGYISSSKSEEFWKDFYDSSIEWERFIVFEGTKEECLEYEQKLLKDEDIKSDLIYNNARGASIIFTEEVLAKMSKSGQKRWENINEDDRKIFGENISKSKLGIPRSEETKKKLSDNLLGLSFVDRFGEDKAKEIGDKISEANTGKPIHSEEYKLNLSEKLKGNNYGSMISDESKEAKRIRFLGENNPGKNKSEVTIRKISNSKKGKESPFKGICRKTISCPHCDKQGGEGIMNRWHFDNCKFK